MGWHSETSKRQELLPITDTPIKTGNPSAIFVVTAGTVKWTDATGTNTHEYALDAGFYPIAISQLMVNTTAVVLGLYE